MQWEGRKWGPRAQTQGNRTETIRWGSHLDSPFSACFWCFPASKPLHRLFLPQESLLPLPICPPKDLKEDLPDCGTYWLVMFGPKPLASAAPHSPLSHPTLTPLTSLSFPKYFKFFLPQGLCACCACFLDACSLSFLQGGFFPPLRSWLKYQALSTLSKNLHT